MTGVPGNVNIRQTKAACFAGGLEVAIQLSKMV